MWRSLDRAAETEINCKQRPSKTEIEHTAKPCFSDRKSKYERSIVNEPKYHNNEYSTPAIIKLESMLINICKKIRSEERRCHADAKKLPSYQEHTHTQRGEPAHYKAVHILIMYIIIINLGLIAGNRLLPTRSLNGELPRPCGRVDKKTDNSNRNRRH